MQILLSRNPEKWLLFYNPTFFCNKLNDETMRNSEIFSSKLISSCDVIIVHSQNLKCKQAYKARSWCTTWINQLVSWRFAVVLVPYGAVLPPCGANVCSLKIGFRLLLYSQMTGKLISDILTAEDQQCKFSTENARMSGFWSFYSTSRRIGARAF